MSDQEETKTVAELALDLREDYQYRLVEIAEHYADLLSRLDEDNDELKAAGMILACGVTIGEVVGNAGSDLEMKHLDALSEFMSCATAMLVHAGKQVKMGSLPSPEIGECLELSNTTETLENTP